MFQHLPGLEFYEDSVYTIKCELLYFDAVLYDEWNAPFICTFINGCFKIWILCSMVEELHHLFGLS